MMPESRVIVLHKIEMQPGGYDEDQERKTTNRDRKNGKQGNRDIEGN